MEDEKYRRILVGGLNYPLDKQESYFRKWHRNADPKMPINDFCDTLKAEIDDLLSNQITWCANMEGSIVQFTKDDLNCLWEVIDNLWEPPQMDIKILKPTHAFIVMWELGLIDALKESTKSLNSTQQGKIIELLIGQKCIDIRKAMSHPDPSHLLLFSEPGVKTVIEKLKEIGYTSKRIKTKN